MSKQAVWGILGAVVVTLLIVVFTAVGTYNGLVNRQQEVDKSWAQVQNVYQRRADLVPNLVQTVQGAANFERSTLEAITNARASVGKITVDPSNAPADAAKLQEFQRAQGELSTALSRLLVVSERYPELKANNNFVALQAQLEGTENRIAVERGRFNDAVQSYNAAIQRFPNSFFAGQFGFALRPYFAAPAEAQAAPSVRFDFSASQPR